MKAQTLEPEEAAGILKEEFASGRAVLLTVTGSSMGPLLRHLRDQVILTAPWVRKPRRGEIVFFRREDGSLVLHRILKEKKDGSYVMNGDAQTWTEEIRRDQILAVVEAVVRKGRYISCDGGGYRLAVALWRFLMPARGTLSALYAAGRNILQKRKDRREHD